MLGQQPDAAGAALQVQVGGRLLSIPPEYHASLALLMRELSNRLQISGPAALQLADVAGHHIHSNEELVAALREGRHPLQASLTAVALRDVEQRKFEVEAKKEELAHFQWQIVVDQMAAFSAEVASCKSQLQGIKDDCLRQIQHCQAEEAMQREHVVCGLTRENVEREVAFKDVDARITSAMQMIHAERSARDVAVHQLQTQMDNVAAGFEAERSQHSQERAETCRLLDAMRHEMDLEHKRNAENWNQHLEMAKRLEVRVDERSATDTSLQHGLMQLGSDCEKLRATVTQLEASQAVHSQAFRDGLHRRSEELSKAVRDEVLGRENHFARFARDLETSFQSLEAKMFRAREDASEGVASLAERARVFEQRCATVEAELYNHLEAQSAKERSYVEQVDGTVSAVDNLEVGMKASDVVLRTTAAKVESLLERVNAAEGDIALRPRHDFFRPQLESLQRIAQKHEAKMGQLEKEMNARFAAEALQRDGVKAQLRTSVRTCLDKIGSSAVAAAATAGKAGRFVEVAGEEPMSAMTKQLSPRISMASANVLGSSGATTPVLPPPNMVCGGQLAVSSLGSLMHVPHATLQLMPPGSMPMAASGATSPPVNCVSRQVSVSGYASPRPTMVQSMQQQGSQNASVVVGQYLSQGSLGAGTSPHSPLRAC